VNGGTVNGERMGIVSELFQSFLPTHDAFLFMWLLLLVGLTSFSTAAERWWNVKRRTDYDSADLFAFVKNLLDQKKIDQAYQTCVAGGKRLLPRIFACGIKKAQTNPLLVQDAMSEESIYAASVLEKRLNYLVMFGNVSTLFGLLGTVYGLIMSFEAVSRPEVAATEKSALLAAGISTAMNSTLVGLSISVLSVLIYAFLRARVDTALQDIDRYAIAIMNILNPPDATKGHTKMLTRRTGAEEEPADADVTPMLNLMIILIPVLLTSSEFARMGAIELKLPESVQGAAGGAGTGMDEQQELKLELGVLITSKGFNVFHYFKNLAKPQADTAQKIADMQPDVPLINGKYDYEGLSKQLSDVRQKVLVEVDKSLGLNVPAGASLFRLYDSYIKAGSPQPTMFPDHETVKIVAEEKTRYETVVSTMDAARGIRTAEGSITMFPNVSIAGGVVQ